MIDTARKQFPSNPNNWLYKDCDENTRVFTKVVYLGINDRGWSECTDAEKLDWESKHKPKDDIHE